MPLQQKYEYILPESITSIEDKEEQVITLLGNVKYNLALLNRDVSLLDLKDILNMVERGKIILLKTRSGKDNLERDTEKEVKINYQIDLSEANNLIRDYRQFSKGGCQSCASLRRYNELPGENLKYCNMFENEKDAIKNSNSSSHSPRVERFYEEGCTERTAILPKTIEKILKESA